MADFARESMMEMFTFEMSQLLEQLEQIIIQDEEAEQFSEQTINEIFRIMHTIKGSAAMMMFNNIQDVSHAIEDLFYFLREKKPANVNYSELADIVLEGEDFIKNELEKIENNQPANGVGDEVLVHIKACLQNLKGTDAAKKEKTPQKARAAKIPSSSEKSQQQVDDSKTEKDDEQNNDNNTSDESEQCYKAHIHFEDGCEMENIRSYTIVHNLEGLVSEMYYIPDDIIENEESIDVIRANGFVLYIKTSIGFNQLKGTLEDTVFLKELTLEEIDQSIFENVRDYGVEELEEEPVEEPVKPVLAEKESVHVEEPVHAPVASNTTDTAKEDILTAPKKTVGQQMISVNISKLDQLQNLTGELVMSEAMVTQNPELEGLELDGFKKAARQLHKIINDVQDTVMSMRLVVLSSTFSKMHRIVRDMCKSLGKDVTLEVEGAETEVDKNIIEHISDPLMHIIRNAVDHGIEMPEDRIKAGKSPRGTVLLEAKNIGGDVLILIKDDGAGISREAVLKKARNNGLIRKPENEYTDREVFQFILMPGFSTNEAVTAYSGRGVGMDVVTTNIEEIGGSVLIDSEEGQGSIFTLKIPLTLAIIEGMIVKLGKAKYTIPIMAIKQSFKKTDDDVFTDPDGNEMIMDRGEAFNLIRLNEFFGIQTDAQKIEDGILIMLESEEQTVCVFADELVGEQQVVVKTLPKYIKKIRGLSGCTILGNGSISLIVDVAGFFND